LFLAIFPLDAFDQTLYQFRHVEYPRPALFRAAGFFFPRVESVMMDTPGEAPLDYLLRVMRDPVADPPRRDWAAARALTCLRTSSKAADTKYDAAKAERRLMEDAGASLVRKLAHFRSDEI
jgi:hypothetical protein